MSVSEYARRMAFLSARIFGEVARKTDTTSTKVVKLFSEKPGYKNEKLSEYYPKHNQMFWMMHRLRFLGLYRDEHRDFKEEMRRLRALRGKVKPKKGEGKRAMKRK